MNKSQKHPVKQKQAKLPYVMEMKTMVAWGADSDGNGLSPAWICYAGICIC
jgi:hypothetical protein